MSLPGGLTGITVTGTFVDGAGNPLGGTVTFWPSAEVVDATGEVIIGMTPITAVVSGTTGTFSQLLAATDNAGLLPEGWTYKIQVGVAGAQQTFNAYIPSSYGSTVDLSVLGPVQPLPSLTGPFVVSVNGQSGPVTLGTTMDLAATTGLAGFALQDATPQILTWTTPADGNMHRVTLAGELVVTGNETGGAIQATITDPGGTIRTLNVLSGGLSAGFNAIGGTIWTVAPDTTVTLAQSSALTGGAARLYAELWGS